VEAWVQNVFLRFQLSVGLTEAEQRLSGMYVQGHSPEKPGYVNGQADPAHCCIDHAILGICE
jgi:hypothetical protein